MAFARCSGKVWSSALGAMRFAFLAAVGTSLLLAGNELHAQQLEAVTARLEWRQDPGAESCLDSEALKGAVNRRWGRTVFVDAATADILLHGKVARSGWNQWSASIELEGPDGTSLGSRELVTNAPECSSLDDSIALAVGLMLDVSRQRVVEERRLAGTGAGTGTGTGAGDHPVPPAPIVDGPAIRIPEATAPARPRLRVEPSFGLEVTLGLLPGLGVGVRPGVLFVPPRFVPLELAVAFLFPEKEHTENGRGAQFSAITAELALCPLGFVRGGFSADTCITERFGQIRAVGFGFASPQTANELVASAGLREVASFQLAQSLALYLGLGVEASFVRYRFLFGESSGAARTIYEMPPVSGSATAGLSLTF